MERSDIGREEPNEEEGMNRGTGPQTGDDQEIDVNGKRRKDRESKETGRRK